MKYVARPEKFVPLVRDMDVVVAGAGTSGLFAALGAAQMGARTLLVERFGQLGGNIGPGMLIGGPLYQEVKMTLHGGQLVGLPAEFMRRVEDLLGDMPRNYATYSHAVSRVALAMMRESGVELMLSAYAADPVMRQSRVAGLFVETKSGRVAVRARVVIDATGDASIAARAGAPIIRGTSPEAADSPNVQPYYKQTEYATWNEGGIYFVTAGTDLEKYRAFAAQKVQLSRDDEVWAAQHLGQPGNRWPTAMVPILHSGWESGEFQCRRELRPRLHVLFNNWFEPVAPGLAGGRAQVHGEYDTGNHEDVTLVETAVRAHAFDGVAFFRRHVPGFEGAHVVCMSAFLGARGGPCIEGEHVLTPQESFAGARFPDVLFVSYVEVHRGGNPDGHDMPYGMLLPKGVDGLLVTGRGAAFLRRGHDPSTRARCNMMTLGQATGMAAALAVRYGVTPRRLEIRTLQRALLAAGFYLGNAARLAELGLA